MHYTSIRMIYNRADAQMDVRSFYLPYFAAFF